jgi:uncharacterized protein YlxW (UPF0749 family)
MAKTLEKARGNRRIWLFIFVLVLGYLLVTWAFDETGTTQLIQDAQKDVEKHVEQEAARHRAVLDKVQEVKADVKKEVAALKPNDVANALNGELQEFRRSTVRTPGLDNSGNRILLQRAGRPGHTGSVEDLQAD